MGQETPKMQCPSCKQFELGFTVYIKRRNIDHQMRDTKLLNGYSRPMVVRCVGCWYTSVWSTFLVQHNPDGGSHEKAV